MYGGFEKFKGRGIFKVYHYPPTKTNIALTRQGQIIVVGTRKTTGANATNVFFVAQLNAAGLPDSTFGSGGISTVDFTGSGSLASASATSVVLTPTGRIDIIGTSFSGIGLSGTGFAVARLLGAEGVPPTANAAVNSQNTAITFSFSEAIVPNLVASDLVVNRVSNPGGPAIVAANFTYDPVLRAGKFIFAPSIPPGTYHVILPGAKVANTAGILLDGNGDGIAGDNMVIDFLSTAALSPHVTQTGSTSAHLSWTAPTGLAITGYRIERSTDGVNFSIVGTAGGAAVGWDDGGLSTGVIYSYGVQAYQTTYNSAWSSRAAVLLLANADNAIYLRQDIDGVHADVWVNSLTPGISTPTLQVSLSQISVLGMTGQIGDDTLTLDFSNGNPLPASGLNFDGGAGVNTVAIIGTTGNDTLTASATGLTFTGGTFSNIPITIANVQSLQFHGGSGGNDSVNLTGGSFTLDADTPTGTPNVSVTVGPTAIANFATDQHLANLTLNGGAANLSSVRHSMFVKGLAISNNGLLDIANSFLYLNNTATSFAAVKTYLDTAYNLHGLGNINAPYAGDYKGVTGITSSVAKASYATDEVVGIGYYDGALQDPNNPDSAGQIVGPNSDSGHGTGIPLTQILIRPTLTGDFNGDGVVNSYDVSLFNSYGLFNNGPTPLGWQAGDLNGDGVVNVKDVTLFNTVGNFNAPPFPVPAVKTAVAKVLAQPVAVKGTSTAVATVPPKSHHVRHHSVRKAGPGKVAARIARVIGALRRV